jgi:hypothetical protein
MVNLEDIVITREDEPGSDSYDLTNLKKNSGTEKVKSESVVRGKNGGARKGAGRKKGSLNDETILRQQALREYRKRVSKVTDRLLNKQLSLAEGIQMLFRIHTDKKGNRGKPELVDDEYEIQCYLNGDFEGNDEDYYFITTAKPDNMAINSILDRTYGKPDQTNILKGDEDSPLEINVNQEQTIRLAEEILNRDKNDN